MFVYSLCPFQIHINDTHTQTHAHLSYKYNLFTIQSLFVTLCPKNITHILQPTGNNAHTEKNRKSHHALSTLSELMSIEIFLFLFDVMRNKLRYSMEKVPFDTFVKFRPAHT